MSLAQKAIHPPLLDLARNASAHRMPWRRSTELLKLITAHLTTHAPLFLGKGADGVVTLNIETLLPKLAGLIANVEELAEFVLEHGTDLTRAEVDDQLTAVDAFRMIAAVLEINCGEDLKNSLADIAKTLSGLVSAEPRTTSTPTSTSTSAPQA